ncbi:unnamed protein product [Lepeophtheirus salmonis]|uniref:(salmon louse) hypothetical protein n=1 Tax=Lepeophtheirus salmonis TaxID=72036 RepID=A0A7R8D1D5_LEPSM|nr:unnamed protein product [Lepeophtheirus salmonis]CAF2994589.1 unnamed protein product [Lepeophtheirus salmonis]
MKKRHSIKSAILVTPSTGGQYSFIRSKGLAPSWILLHKKTQAWESISEATGVDAMRCIAKWKYLRDKFVRELKREKVHRVASRWSFFEHMQFINEFTYSKTNYFIPSVKKSALPTRTQSTADYKIVLSDCSFPLARHSLAVRVRRVVKLVDNTRLYGRLDVVLKTPLLKVKKNGMFQTSLV